MSSSSDTRIARVLASLKRVGALATPPRDARGCVEILGEYENTPFALYLFPGRYTNNIIIKIEKIVKSCFEALYSPTGLYAITSTGELDPDRLRRKLAIVTRLHEA